MILGIIDIENFFLTVNKQQMNELTFKEKSELWELNRELYPCMLFVHRKIFIFIFVMIEMFVSNYSKIGYSAAYRKVQG